MHAARSGAATVLLDDGRILSAGGWNDIHVERSSEVYSPWSDTWTITGSLDTPKHLFAFTKLLDGRVFIAGGWIDYNHPTFSSTEIFDPQTNTWQNSTPLNEPTEGASAVTLPNGKVLIVSGVVAGTYNYKTACEVYDPRNTSVSYTGAISQGQFNDNVLVNQRTGGAILIAGHDNGAQGNWFNETEEYDTSTGIWSVTAHSQVSHSSHENSIVLPDGRIIAVAGSVGPPGTLIGQQSSSVVEIYDPASKQWSTVGNIAIPRYGHCVAYIGGDSILVVGGLDPTTGKSLSDCQYINIRTSRITAGPPMKYGRSGFNLIVIKSVDIERPCLETYRVYAIGGIGGFAGQVDVLDSALSSCEMIEFRRTATSVLVVPPSVSYSGSACSTLDTTLTLHANTCSTIRIDSVALEGLGGSHVNTPALPHILRNNDECSLTLSIQSLPSGITNGRIHIFYGTNGGLFDTTIAVNVTLANATRGTIRSIVHDIANASDTVTVPVYLANNSGDTMQGFDLVAHFHPTDALTPLDPDFGGTLTANPTIWDKNDLSSGIEVYALKPFSIVATMPLVNLKFFTHNIGNNCATLTIDNVSLTADNSNPCPYVVLVDSAQICRAEASVSDASYSQTETLTAYFDGARNRIVCTDNIPFDHTIEFVNILGQIVSSRNLNASDHNSEVSAIGLPSGLYIARTFYQGNVLSVKILVRR